MYVVIFITAKNTAEANRIVAQLIEDKLAACVNIIKGVKSVFWWEGKVDKSDEVLLVVKSKKSLFSKLQKAVKKLHSYTVPEIIALPVVAGNKDYLDWIGQSCRK